MRKKLALAEFVAMALSLGLAIGIMFAKTPQPSQAKAEFQPVEAIANACFASLGTVTQYSSTDSGAAQQAVDDALPGGVIKLAGTCLGVQVRNGLTQTLYISKPISVRGGYTVTDWASSDPIANPTTLNAAHMGRVIYITGTPATVENEIVVNGNTDGDGGGIYAGGDLTLTSAIVMSSTAAQNGGGAYILGTLILSGGSFVSNTAGNTGGGGGGGGLYVNGSSVLTGTRFMRNNAIGFGGGMYAVSDSRTSAALFEENMVHQVNNDGGGGGLFAQSTLILTDTAFISNTATEPLHDCCTVARGGGLYVIGAAHLNGGKFERNETFYYGGGLDAESTLALSGTKFLSNTAIFGGGGGAAVIGAASLNNGVFNQNEAGDRGGGLFAITVDLTGTLFMKNRSVTGGGAYVGGAATVQAGVFEQNTAGYGGGLQAIEPLVISGTLFAGNHAIFGGGIDHAAYYSPYTATVSNARFENNTATYSGGAIYSQYPLLLKESVFVANQSGTGGGALMRNWAGQISIVNVLFARNWDASGTGNAIAATSSTGIQLLHTTIASPTMSSGAAILIAGGTAGITDTLIAGYTVGISATGGTVYEDYNLFTSVATPTAGTVTSGFHHPSGDPAFLNPAADNYHLWKGSAAIDTGVDAGVAVDVDGQPRPQGAGFDIGYDEFSGTFQSAYLPLVMR